MLVAMVRRGDREAVRCLLKSSSSVADKTERLSVYVAAFQGDLTLLQYLLQMLTLMHKSLFFALVLAINQGHLECVRYLVEHHHVDPQGKPGC